MSDNTLAFTPDVQQLFLQFLLSNAELYGRVQNIYNPENFHKSVRRAARFLQQHVQDHNCLPDPEQMRAVTGQTWTLLQQLDSGHEAWFLQQFEAFTRRQELERAIFQSVTLLEQGEYDPVEALIKQAVQISLTRDLGTDYWQDPRARLLDLKNHNGQVSTGWSQLDSVLYGGFNRRELEIVAGGSGSGKSLVLQNLACNWLLAQLNGIYITLELSESLCAMRMDAMLTSRSTRELFQQLDQVELQLHQLKRQSGQLRIRYMPAQSTVNHIRAYVKELQIQTGFVPDFICVDYLDLMTPVTVKVSASDSFTKDKYVSEELRNLAHELNVVLLTASQINRSGVEEMEFDHSHIAGGISKIYTADNVMGIFTSRAMRERGKYQLQLMKTRNSGGVGRKLDLDFDINSLRITDPGTSAPAPSQAHNVLSQIKQTSVVHTGVASAAAPVQKAGTVTAQSSRLRSLLSQLKTQQD